MLLLLLLILFSVATMIDNTEKTEVAANARTTSDTTVVVMTIDATVRVIISIAVGATIVDVILYSYSNSVVCGRQFRGQLQFGRFMG